MEIIKVAFFAFTALFIFLLLKDKKSEVGLFVVLAAGIGIFLYMIGQLGDVIDFIKEIANKANIDTVYIGIVLKILAIAYITSFCSEICKDSGAGKFIMFDVSLLFKIGAMGILLMVIEKVLKGNGKDEIAVLANLAGMVIILITIIGMISNLFDTVKTMFTF